MAEHDSPFKREHRVDADITAMRVIAEAVGCSTSVRLLRLAQESAWL